MSYYPTAKMLLASKSYACVFYQSEVRGEVRHYNLQILFSYVALPCKQHCDICQHSLNGHPLPGIKSCFMCMWGYLNHSGEFQKCIKMMSRTVLSVVRAQCRRSKETLYLTTLTLRVFHNHVNSNDTGQGTDRTQGLNTQGTTINRIRNRCGTNE